MSTLSQRGFSRRQLVRISSMLAAGASLPFYNEAALAQRASAGMAGGMFAELPPDAVRIGGNENPIGPCPEAIEAASKIIGRLNRYQPGNERKEFVSAAAEMEGLKK